MTVSDVASVRALRSLLRRACDSVRGQSTTPWPPEPADVVAPEFIVEGRYDVVVVPIDDLHHHQGNCGFFFIFIYQQRRYY